MSRWKLTLPIAKPHGDPHKPWEVDRPELEQGTPPIYLAVEKDGGSATLIAYLRGTSPHGNKVLDGLKPDTVFSYRIRIEDSECRLFVAHGDVLPSHPEKTFDRSDLGDPGTCFFKAGAYNKSEVEHGSGQVVVRHSRLEVK